MNGKKSGISRREFARRAALVSAAGALKPLDSVISPESGSHFDPPQETPGAPKLSGESRAEAEARYEAIIKEYGDRFSGDQKKDLRRLCYIQQPQLERLRVFAVHNGDSPALYLKPLVERDKKPAAVVPARRTS